MYADGIKAYCIDAVKFSIEFTYELIHTYIYKRVHLIRKDYLENKTRKEKKIFVYFPLTRTEIWMYASLLDSNKPHIMNIIIKVLEKSRVFVLINWNIFNIKSSEIVYITSTQFSLHRKLA